jgi:hypothetical protein
MLGNVSPTLNNESVMCSIHPNLESNTTGRVKQLLLPHRKSRHPGRSEAESRDPAVFATSMDPGSALRLSGMTT